jgi:3'(2'), 5'-bisphosphate nucleotidase
MWPVSLDVVVDVAVEAGRAIEAIKAQALAGVMHKVDTSPVTEADHTADAIIRRRLAQLGGHVVTEESHTGDAPDHGWVWWVDPLDGTRDFIAGRDDYAVQIGLVHDGVPVLGVVHQPATGRTWRGDVATRRCEGSHRHGPFQTVVPIHRSAASPRAAVSISHPSRSTEVMLDACGCARVPRGSVGIKIAAILDNDADVYLSDSRHLHGWDTAAPAAIAVAAGLTVCALDGQPLRYGPRLAHDAGVFFATNTHASLRARAHAALAMMPAER